MKLRDHDDDCIHGSKYAHGGFPEYDLLETCPGGRVPTRQELIDALDGSPLDWCVVHATSMPGELCEAGWSEYAETKQDPDPMCEQETVFIVKVTGTRNENLAENKAAIGGGT